MTIAVDDALVRRAVEALRTGSVVTDEARSIADTLETALPVDAAEERLDYTAEEMLNMPDPDRRRIMMDQIAHGVPSWEAEEPTQAQIALGILYDVETHQPTDAPSWLSEIKPQNPDGWKDLDRSLEPWPGDETDQHLLEALERMS